MIPQWNVTAQQMYLKIIFAKKHTQAPAKLRVRYYTIYCLLVTEAIGTEQYDY